MRELFDSHGMDDMYSLNALNIALNENDQSGGGENVF